MKNRSILLVATTNKGKIKEISEELLNLGLEIKTLLDFPEIEPPEETGKTFFENALLKAKYYAEKTGSLTIADDSGLEVEALGGKPGIYSSRFAG
ncbi:MAG: non-canonical purine NTP pyrophosphatase, partial [Caldimicrobium sp.]